MSEVKRIDVNRIAGSVVTYLQVATGDCAGEYLRMLRSNDKYVSKEMLRRWKEARARPRMSPFDEHGWVADYLFNDPDWCADLAGDRICQLMQLPYGDPDFENLFDEVCEALARKMPWVKDAMLAMRHGS